MAFRNYNQTKSLCIEKHNPTDLDLAIDSIQNEYDIIDLQFSTHCNKKGEEKYCAFLLLVEKENK